MLQVQVLVQEDGKYIESEFKKVKVAAFNVEDLQTVYPVHGNVVVNTSGVIAIESGTTTITFVKQAYVK